MISRIRSARGLAVVVGMTVMGGAFAAAPAGAQSAAEPVVAYWTTDEAIVADALGREIRRFPNFAKLSLGNNVLAGEVEVAVRVEKDATQEYGYNLDIVKFDAITGEMTYLVTEGNPCCIGVSATLGKIGYGFSDRDGFAVFDLSTGTTVDFPGEVYVPHLSGENRL